jgi:hypothetical protein
MWWPLRGLHWKNVSVLCVTEFVRAVRRLPEQNQRNEPHVWY